MTGGGLVTWAEGAASGGGQSGSNVHTKTNETFRGELFPVFAGLVVLIGNIRHVIPNVILESFDLAHLHRE